MNDETDNQSAENGQTPRKDNGQFAEGNAGGPGRPKGSHNGLGAELKQDLVEAYRQRGGVEWLRGLKDHEFVRLLQRVMPKEIALDLHQDQPPVIMQIVKAVCEANGAKGETKPVENGAAPSIEV